MYRSKKLMGSFGLSLLVGLATWAGSAMEAEAQCVGGAPDGSIDPLEFCDDNNIVAGDGCTANCTIENDFSCARTLNFAELMNYDYPGSSANWVIADDGLSGVQTENSSDPTFALFGENSKQGTFATQWEVQETGGDNDWIGAAFGFEPGDEDTDDAANDADYLLLTWKQEDQAPAVEGMFLHHVLGAQEGPPITHPVVADVCAVPGVSPCVTGLAEGVGIGASGWEDDTVYNVHSTYTDNRLQVIINGSVVFDVTPNDFPGEFAGNVFPGGQMGLFTLSQPFVSFTNLAPFGPSVCNSSMLDDVAITVDTGSGPVTIDVASLFTDLDDMLVGGGITVDSITGAGTAQDPPGGAADGTIVFTPIDNGVDGTYIVTFTACDDHPIIPHCETATATITYTSDFDGDGVPNGVDLDNDNDGIPDAEEGDGAVDSDDDGIPDSRDLDSDNDGILDIVEAGHAGLDADGDGYVDGPVGANGIADSVETAVDSGMINYDLADTDDDGVPDWRDLDSDNDGIPDVIEAGHDGVDADGDGRLDGPVGDNGIVDSLETAPDSGVVDYDGDGNGPDAPVDTDGDGIADFLDLDSDNDGINDVIEAGGTDADGDGMQDGTADADGDGLLDTVDIHEGGTPLVVPDTDGDGVDNYRDLDSDNDSISDLVEGGSGGIDLDNDGVVDGPDTDGDGINDSVDGFDGHGDTGSPALPDDDSATDPDSPNYIDVDSDGDGTNDIVDAGNGALDSDGDGMIDDDTDVDGDGIADVFDDSDGDGIPDINDPDPGSFGGASSPQDFDGDGILDGADLDDDNDGIPDALEGSNGLNPVGDDDADGILNYLDADASGCADADSDGVCDAIDPLFDFDGDGLPNHQDLDSDGDGIMDAKESGFGAVDVNGDGILECAGGFGDNGLCDEVEDSPDSGTTANPRNSDDDDAPDFLDLDADNDNISDEEEDPVDSDGDGIDDYIDTDSDNDGISDKDEAGDEDLDTPPIDTDGDGTPDYLDTDSDNDGIPDEDEGRGDADGDGLPDYRDRDSDNDGLDDGLTVTGGGCSVGGPGNSTGFALMLLLGLGLAFVGRRKRLTVKR